MDDISLHFTNIREIAPVLQHIVNALDNVGMKLATNKYEVLKITKEGKDEVYEVTNTDFRKEDWHTTLKLNSEKTTIRYLGDQLGESKFAIKSRLEKAEKAYGALRSVLWGQTEVSVQTKVKVFKSIVMSVMLYALKTHKAMDAEMRPLRHFCLRKLKSLFGLNHDAHTSYYGRYGSTIKRTSNKMEMAR